MERRRTSFVYYAWASTTCIEAFVLLSAPLAPGRLAPRSAKTLGVPREYSKHLGVPSYTWVYPRGGTRHYLWAC